jgi:hypothetical protein
MTQGKSSSRDAKGRFVAGCAPGPGRPPAPKERAYLDSFRQTVSLENWQTAVEAILAKAIKGDVRCFETLAKFAMPLPAQRLEWQLAEEREGEFRVAGATSEELAEEMVREVMATLEKVQEAQAQIHGTSDSAPRAACGG